MSRHHAARPLEQQPPATGQLECLRATIHLPPPEHRERLQAGDESAVAELARTYGVAFDREDVAQLLHDTDGWALASEWLVRDAADGANGIATSGRAL